MNKWIGKAVLYTVATAVLDGNIFEGEVQQIAPSGKYVRIGYTWYAVGQVTVLEEVPEPPKEDKVVRLPAAAELTAAELTGPGLPAEASVPAPGLPAEASVPEAAPAPTAQLP